MKVAFKPKQEATHPCSGERAVKVNLLLNASSAPNLAVMNFFLFVITVNLLFQIVVLALLLVRLKLEATRVSFAQPNDACGWCLSLGGSSQSSCLRMLRINA